MCSGQSGDVNLKKKSMNFCPVQVTLSGLHSTSLNPPDVCHSGADVLEKMSREFIVLLLFSGRSICS